VDSRLTLPPNTVLDGAYRINRVVGSGGFGITYEAEDINLGTRIAIKEYYPFDFGDRDATMSVRPKSDRHAKTFQWGRSNFLDEARNLARFEHPSIVRVTRVFEANSTAYMIMRFEEGQSLEEWLKSSGRPPTQEELDAIVAPLLEALQLMHKANFLHRDIAPDNIIVRADGTPVLLDFGAARRAVAEMSRSLTGIVKPGYSPHEQYTSDSRLQGPWSDLYAFGGTLYRAVTGTPPEEATLRVDNDLMPPAVQIAKGKYRKDFLGAIDTCLKVRASERPQSVTQLRSKLLGQQVQSEPGSQRLVDAPQGPSKPPPGTRRISTVKVQPRITARRWPAIAAVVVAIAGGSYGGYEFMRWQPDSGAEARRTADAAAAKAQADKEAAAKMKADTQELAKRQAQAEARRLEEARLAAERARQEAEAKRLADAAEAKRKAEEEELARRWEQERIAAQRDESARREAEAKRLQEERIAAEEAARRKADAKEQPKSEASARATRTEDEPIRVVAVTLSADERTTFVKRVQDVLRVSRCYDGEVNGRTSDAQKALDRFVNTAREKGKGTPVRIELAKATASDFDTWLRDADDVKSNLCPKPKPEKPVAQARERPPARERPTVRERPEPRPQRAPQRDYSSGGGGGTIQGIR
jgi:serine/threonine protein kinase